jgi:hypothetical protein
VWLIEQFKAAVPPYAGVSVGRCSKLYRSTIRIIRMVISLQPLFKEQDTEALRDMMKVRCFLFQCGMRFSPDYIPISEGLNLWLSTGYPPSATAGSLFLTHTPNVPHSYISRSYPNPEIYRPPLTLPLSPRASLNEHLQVSSAQITLSY